MLGERHTRGARRATPAHHRAVDPRRRFRQARRGGARGRRRRRRLDPCRRHGRPFRAQHLHRAGRGEGDPAAHQEAARRASDDRAVRSAISKPSPRPAPTSSPCMSRPARTSHRSLQAIRALGKKAGVTMNPGTPEEPIAHVIDIVDLILVMSVNPGLRRPEIHPRRRRKGAQAARAWPAAARSTSRSTAASPPETAPAAARAGANAFVAGSAVFKDRTPGAYRANIAAIRTRSPVAAS